MKKLLILGATGQVGRRVLDFAERAQGWEPYGTYHNKVLGGGIPFKLGDPGGTVRVFDAVKPDFVVFAGGLAAVDYCESHPDLAQKINVDGTEMIVDLCRKRGWSSTPATRSRAFALRRLRG